MPGKLRSKVKRTKRLPLPSVSSSSAFSVYGNFYCGDYASWIYDQDQICVISQAALLDHVPCHPWKCQLMCVFFFVIKTDEDVNGAGAGSSVKNVDGFWNEQSTDRHPLLIDVVLNTLFAYVDPTDLVTCRLVCKKWNNVLMSFVRATFEVRIRSDESLYPTLRNLTDFVKLFESNTLGSPFGNFQLTAFDPTIGNGHKFLQFHGPTAKRFDFYATGTPHAVEDIAVFLRSAPMLESIKLPLCLCSNYGVKRVKLFTDSRTQDLKNLRTLDLGNGRTKESKLICPTFLEEILTAAKNISTLLMNDCRENPTDMTSLEVLNILERLGRGHSLETLAIYCVKEEHLNVLRRMTVKSQPDGLKLKHLRVISNDRFSFDLIEMMKDSLISLNLCHSGPFHQQLPRMPNLQLLDFELVEHLDRHVNMVQDFNHNFPSLKDLSLNISVEQFSVEMECCPMIESLRMKKLSDMNVLTFQTAIDVFPHLTELEVNVTAAEGPQLLQMIWTQLQRLEKLNIYGRLPGRGHNIDSLFTGILNKRKRTVMNGKLAGLENMTSEDRKLILLNLIDESKTLPAIGNLQNLRELTLDIMARNNHLTDMTGYLGLYSLKSLRSLNVSMCRFSESCSQILVQDLGLESWIVQGKWKTDIICPRWKPIKERDFPNPKFSFKYTI